MKDITLNMYVESERAKRLQHIQLKNKKPVQIGGQHWSSKYQGFETYITVTI